MGVSVFVGVLVIVGVGVGVGQGLSSSQSKQSRWVTGYPVGSIGSSSDKLNIS